jgi:NADPH-dependent 2,4-dienoyl-CoA reductase/sulfur reductase-like enzyme
LNFSHFVFEAAMKKSLKLLVIGGVAAGTKGASKARRDDPSMEISLVTEEPYVSYAGCGLGYYIAGIIDTREALFARSPEEFREKHNISILLRHRAESINTYDRTVRVTDLASGAARLFPYDRLLIATGSTVNVPVIPGADIPGVFPLKGIGDADSIKARLDRGGVREACIVGGGFIGIEMSECLALRGVASTILEKEDHLLHRLYDPETAKLIRAHVESKGIRIRTGETVERFDAGADGSIGSFSSGGEEYPCQIAILASGVYPNAGLAREARIAIGPTGAIKTDSRMETSVRGVFAAGDCAETTHLVTGKPFWFPLGSTANMQGRVAGANIAGGRTTFPGALGTSILKVFDKTAARTGLSAAQAVEAGYNPVSATVTVQNHSRFFPGAGTIVLTLVADRGSHRLLGAQAFGDSSTDKVIDTVATALTGKIPVTGLANLDVSYSPPYSTALGAVLVAAEVLEGKLG